MPDSLRALIVEDDPNDVELLIDVLREAGFEVAWRAVDDDESMRDALRRDIWDVVLSDHAMPRFNAIAAVDVLREYDRDTPFIIVSGAIGEEAAVAAIRHGVADYVPKQHLQRLETVVRREMRSCEERRSLRLARERIALLAAAVTQSADGVVIYERVKGDSSLPMIVYANAAVQRETGYAQDELLGRTAMVFAGPEPDTNVLQKLRSIFDQYETSSGEYLSYRRSGQPYWVEITCQPLAVRDSNTVYWVMIRRDLTERHRVERALRVSEAAVTEAQVKSEFVATMSHEVRTPMNAVVGMSELLLASELSHEQREHATLLHDAAKSLLRIINDVLDFSKIEAGRLELERLPFGVHALASGVAGMLLPAANAKRLALEVSIDQRVPERLVGDSGRLRQVLINLVANAIKFTETGGVRLEIRNDGVVDGAVALYCAVSDTGIGISDEARMNVFEAYRQGDTSTARRFGGTGLGLTISKRIVEMMGGTMQIASQLGKGSTFSFRVLLGLPEGERVDVLAEPPEPLVTTLTGPRPFVLVAEDNLVNQRLAAAQLRKLGVDIDLASSGREAIAFAATGRYDLILMDWQMPDIDGLEATREIRREESRSGGHVPIIAMTANARPSDREACIEAGMDDYIAKPVTLEALRGVMKQWLPQNAAQARS